LGPVLVAHFRGVMTGAVDPSCKPIIVNVASGRGT
jgi:hypothetical protein